MSESSFRTLLRGVAARRDLTVALDELGITDGQPFIIAHPSVVDERQPHLAPSEADAPMLPGFTGATSRLAAVDHYPRSGTARLTALEALFEAGERGATSDEIAESRSMRLYTVKPRLIELRRGGWARRTGATRPSSTGAAVDVYEITEDGIEVVRSARAA